MKKIILLPGFLWLLFFKSFAQDYNPFPAAYTYQFEYSGGDSLYVIKVDSSVYRNGDSIFYFNPVVDHIKPCVANPLSDNIFGKTMIRSGNEYAFITSSRDTFLLKPLASPGEQWEFSSVDTTTATLLERTVSADFADSVAIIRLSSGGEIKIGKRLGFIQTPSFVPLPGGTDTLRLSAIPEVQLGAFIFDPFLLYDFELGETFGFESAQYPFYTFTHLYTSVSLKVIDKQVYTDSIVYDFQRFKKIPVNPGASDFHYDVTEDTSRLKVLSSSVKVIPSRWFQQGVEKLDSSNTSVYQSSRDSSFYTFFNKGIFFDNALNTYVVNESAYYYADSLKKDSVYLNCPGQFYFLADPFDKLNKAYGKSLGELLSDSVFSGIIQDDSRGGGKKVLLCYSNSSSSYGNCDSLQNFIMAVTPVRHQNLFSYSLRTNPVQTTLMIKAPETDFHYEIISMEGKSLKSGLGKGETSVPVPGIPAGLYLLKLQSGNDLETLRFVKE